MKFESYNLNNICGFNQVLLSKDCSDNYYTVTEYYTKSNQKYKIVRYNKDILAVDLISNYGLLRSVIINSDNKVVSFAPPKSLPADQFIKNYPTKMYHIVAQEFVEGTMINVFYDSYWKIATRNTVDADISFYKKQDGKTFKTMFEEACQENGLVLDALNRRFCYSFVLQHPDNRIVVPFSKPQLYLVEAYEIVIAEFLEDPVPCVRVIPQNISTVRTDGQWQNTTVRFPEVYEFTTYSELIDKFASANTPYNIMGIVIKNMITNERAKIRNPIYEEVRHLKGNHCKLQYQYLTLRKEGKLPEFLKYYPETKKEFSECRDKVHIFTNTLYQNYLACYVRKEKPLGEFGTQYRTHMFKIHQQFINDLRPHNFFVNNTIVQKYVNNLHPSLLMHSLNYHVRKQNVDTIKANV
jgi:hypothetical protein